MKWMQRNIVAMVVAVALSVGLVGPVAAQTQTGLVNLSVGDVTILQDVNVGVAAQVAANLCNVQVGPVVLLGVSVVRTGQQQTVCTTNQGPVIISQQ